MSDSPSGATAPSLSVSGGPADGQALVISDSMERSLGSGPECHLQIELPNVEADHARVVWASRGVLLSDCGTTAGTFVNGEKIASEHPLNDGDRIFLGPPGSKESAKLVVHVPAHLPAEPPAPAPGATPPPARAAAQPPAAKKAQRAEYTDDMPSMVATETRDAGSAPAAVAAPRPKAAPLKGRKAMGMDPTRRMALMGGGAAVVALMAFFGMRALHRPPPVVLSITPPRGEAGQTITIAGTGFSSDPAKNTVRFGDLAGQVGSASDTQLSVTVPDVKVSAGSANVSVTVDRRGNKSNALFFTVSATPKVTSLAPEVAMPGDEVTAAGKNLAGSPLTVSVGAQAAEVIEAKPTSLRFRVPAMPVVQGKTLPVLVQVGSETGKPANLLMGRLPLVVEASPPRAMAGERVVLHGRGFDASVGGNAVFFAGQPALVLAASATELTVSAPAVGTDTLVSAPVAVQTHDKTSSSECVVTIARPSSVVYVPRFFLAPVTDHPGSDRVFVSNELGPVLLLSGKADAPSTAERAERAATALNSLFDAALSGKPAVLEARDKPAPALAVVGSPQPIVTATPADAAGYEELDPAAKGRRATPQGLAAYWAALVQDQLLLFVTHQRPFRMLELTPRGKVLTEIFTEAGRHAGPGRGVPTNVVSPTPPSLARGLRDLALLLPAEGQTRSAAAVEGHWAGTMEEGETGSRAVDLRLRADAGRLGGSFTTRSGGLSMDVPLRDASYDKGTLRFVIVMRGSPKYFDGTLNGDAIEGTIHAAAGAKEAVGRFSLRYVE